MGIPDSRQMNQWQLKKPKHFSLWSTWKALQEKWTSKARFWNLDGVPLGFTKIFTGCLLFTKIVACSLRINVESFIRFRILLESLKESQLSFLESHIFFKRNPTESHGIRRFFFAESYRIRRLLLESHVICTTLRMIPLWTGTLKFYAR